MFDVNCAVCGKFMTKETEEATSCANIVCTAVMQDSRRFTFGLASVYEFTKDFNLKEGDEVCNECIKKHQDDFQPVKEIKCDVCEELYENCYEDIGWDCSSEVFDSNGVLKLGCGFGSEHDLDTYSVMHPDIKIGHKICDKCIDELPLPKGKGFPSQPLASQRKD